MATTEERTFIEMRQEGYRQAHNSLDVSTLLSWMSQDIDYSDHGIGVVHISKSGLHDLATAVFSSVKDMVFTTVSLNGTKSFTAWEWIAKGTLLKEIPGIPLKVGDEFESMGCSLFWWKEGGGEEGSILKMAEYSRFVGI
ncbi:uncharacterized protein PAC_12306 [Phialocephala subalpina]|uniref:SnoaL-like domain-containing protein n=1 Tax=Phialocephala subalpina TaxID=576137 RepID=A0A1L7XBK6_9HELO|nr:uncharacterized protein PAC_12306 [Phialocephala subalpina]